MKTAQPIRSKRNVRELTSYYLNRNEIRNHVLVVMGVHTALRISDLLALTWDDVYDFHLHRLRENITLVEKKTGKTKTVLLNKSVLAALKLYTYAAKEGCPLMVSRKGDDAPITRQQAHRILSQGAQALEFSVTVSSHSLRKTFGYLAWKSGISPAVIMKIYNHTSLAVTQRYLGITQDDLDDCYRKLADVL
jgi:integrase